jgi:hypothetical protein
LRDPDADRISIALAIAAATPSMPLSPMPLAPNGSGTMVKETMLRIGDLEIDLLARIARRRGREIELLPREFRLLAYLARNAGQVVHAPCSCSRYGTCISIRRPTSSMSMLAAFVGRSTAIRTIR